MNGQRNVLDVVEDDLWARRSAEIMAAAITSAVQQRERCLLALSGGSSPLAVFEKLARLDVPWPDVTIFQADDRIVPGEHEARNLAAQQEHLGRTAARWLALPVDRLLADGVVTDDPAAPVDVAAVDQVLDEYADELTAVAGSPPVFDLVHLGLGSDGHTASLVPGDPVVGELRRYVALTEPYEAGGLTTRRLTLTRPILDRARMILWLVSGSSKGPMLNRLLAGDMSIPAGLIHPPHSVVVADRSAARAVHDAVDELDGDDDATADDQGPVSGP